MSSQDVAGPQAAPARGTTGGGSGVMLVVLLLGQLMGLVDVFVVNVAMPQIGLGLHASGASLQLVVGGYTVAYAMLLITGARLGAVYGRRRMYMVGVAAFTLASLACGFAPDTVALVVLRFVQGASAALMIPQIISVIQMRFTGAARAKALSAYGATLSLGSVLGLVLGGVIINANILGETWRPIFLINVPIGVILLGLVPLVVPKDEPTGSRKLDIVGLAIVVPAVFLVVLPLVLGHDEGWPAWTFICIAAGLVLCGVFLAVERKIADPLLNLKILRIDGVGAGMITISTMQIAYGGFLFVFTLHLQAGLGHSALRTGMIYLPMSATFGLVGYFWRRLPARLHFAVAPVGLALCALSYVGISVAMRDGGSGGALMWASLTLDGVGMGLSASPLLTQALVNVPMNLAADASGVLTTTVQLSQVLGVAAVGTLYFSLRQHALTPGITMAHGSASALETTCFWIAGLCLVGVLTGIGLARIVLRRRVAGPAIAVQPVPGPAPAR